MGRRTILLIAALVVAALGAVLVWLYAQNADERAQAGAAQVQVLVATADIAAGLSGSAISSSGTAELQEVDASTVPAGALSDLTPVVDLVTLSPVYAGQILLQQMFGTQSQSSGGLTLPEGTMAVSVQLGDPQRVAGFVNPGSEVAIFVTASGLRAVDPNATEEEAAAAQQAETALLLERVPVVAVGPTTTSTSTTTDETGTTNTEAIPTAILTLALDQPQAQRLIQSTTSGSLYFGLLNEQSVVDPGLPGTTTETLIDN